MIDGVDIAEILDEVIYLDRDGHSSTDLRGCGGREGGELNEIRS